MTQIVSELDCKTEMEATVRARVRGASSALCLRQRHLTSIAPPLHAYVHSYEYLLVGVAVKPHVGRVARVPT